MYSIMSSKSYNAYTQAWSNCNKQERVPLLSRSHFNRARPSHTLNKGVLITVHLVQVISRQKFSHLWMLNVRNNCPRFVGIILHAINNAPSPSHISQGIRFWRIGQIHVFLTWTFPVHARSVEIWTNHKSLRASDCQCPRTKWQIGFQRLANFVLQ